MSYDLVSYDLWKQTPPDARCPDCEQQHDPDEAHIYPCDDCGLVDCQCDALTERRMARYDD